MSKRFKNLLKKKKKKKRDLTNTTVTTNQNTKKIKQDLPMPPENELNNMFENLLTELGLPDLTKKQMRQMTNEKKWIVLCQHKSKTELKSLEAQSGKSLENTPKSYIDQLKTNSYLQLIIELRTALSSNPLSWMIEFLNLGGLSILVNSLSQTAHKQSNQKTKSDESLTNEFLRAFKAIMNNNVGLEAFLSDKKSTIVIAMCLDLKDWAILKRTIELLIVISVVPPNGHKQCLEALSYFREKRNLKSRFAILTNLLKKSIGDKNSKEFQESCLMFINSLIDTPQEPYACLELRKEFALLGIRRILKKFDNEKTEGLNIQIQKFEEGWSRDEKTTGEIIEDIPERDETNTGQIFEFLCKNMMSSEFKDDFLKIINKFCDISFDTSLTVWSQIDSLTSRILEMDIEKDGANVQELLFGCVQNQDNEKIQNLESLILQQKDVIKEYESNINLLLKASSFKLINLKSIIKQQNEKKEKLSTENNENNNNNGNNNNNNNNNNNSNNNNNNEDNNKEKLIIKELNGQLNYLLNESQELEKICILNETGIECDDLNNSELVKLNQQIIFLNSEIEILLQNISNLQGDALTYQQTIITLNTAYLNLQNEIDQLEDEMNEMNETKKVPTSFRGREIIEFTEEKQILGNEIKELKEQLNKKKKQIEENKILLNKEIEKMNNQKTDNKKEQEEEEEEEEENEKKKNDQEENQMKNLDEKILELENNSNLLNQFLLSMKTKNQLEIDNLNQNLKDLIELNNLNQNNNEETENGNELNVTQWKNKIKDLKNKKQFLELKKSYINEKEKYLNEIQNLIKQLCESKLKNENYKKEIELLKESYKQRIELIKNNKSKNFYNEKDLDYKIENLEKGKEYYVKKINSLIEDLNNVKIMDKQKIENLKIIINNKKNNLQFGEIKLKKQKLIIGKQQLNSTAYQQTITKLKQYFENKIENYLNNIDEIRYIYEQELLKQQQEGSILPEITKTEEEIGKELTEKDEQIKSYELEIKQQEVIMEEMNKEITQSIKENNYLENNNIKLKNDYEELRKNEKNIEKSLEVKINGLQSKLKYLQENNILDNILLEDRSKLNQLENQIRKLKIEILKENNIGKLLISNSKNISQSLIGKINNEILFYQMHMKEINNDMVLERRRISKKMQTIMETKLTNNNKINEYEEELVTLSEELQNYIELQTEHEKNVKQLENDFKLQLNDLIESKSTLKNDENKNKNEEIGKEKEKENEKENEKEIEKENAIDGKEDGIHLTPPKNTLNDDDDDDYYDENTYGFGKKRIKFENLIKKIDEENKEFNRQLMANYEEEDGEKELMLNILNSTKPSNKNQENDHNNDNDNANDNKPDENQNIPKVQMKNLNWKPISQQKIQNTIWSKISMEKVELNTEKLEKYFNLSDTLNEILNNKKEIKVLSKERSIKYETVLNKINIPLGELKAGIMNFDEKAISVQQLKDLIDLSSTNSEFSKIAEYKEIKKNDNNFLNSNSINIGRGEEFLIEMSVIPNFLNKLNSWYCQRTFKDKIKKINTMNEDILLACNELRSSKSLKTILRVILAIGNYLNGGTFRGGAHGFKLSSLTKLYNVKGNNINSPNLLHYLGYFLKLKYPDAKQLLSQLPHLSAATRTKNSFIKKEFLKINFGLKAIQNELSHFEHHRNNDKNIINNNDNNQINLLFFKIMNPFLNDAISEFKKCVNSFSNCQKRFSETISYFGEDYKLKPSDFFAPIFDFCKKLDRILNESGLQRTTTTFPRAKQSGVGLLEGIFKTLRTKIDITMVNDEN
ncbi:disheveled-associated activator of morphogenesis [Anaeramoeba flamelloides]|uniref:Disheveled-associated activator of morphogenesis n=1 Tax=Anaeramoeba flamelloides TaxID=1746091 RepID=A0AAV8A917_9EUKA|nr:disheveled-associated activator of morphogenesis [Anaeramoeba flamelloides]